MQKEPVEVHHIRYTLHHRHGLEEVNSDRAAVLAQGWGTPIVQLGWRREHSKDAQKFDPDVMSSLLGVVTRVGPLLGHEPVDGVMWLFQ